MSELRWILLGLGALFCVGLWVWETRRRRQASGSLREFDSEDATLSSYAARARTRDARQEQARMEPTLGEAIAIEDGAPEFDDTAPDDLSADASFVARREEAADGPVEPEGQGADPGDATIDAQAEEAMPPDEIVSLRVLAPPQKPFEGRELIKALHASGLEHGKFSIFHKYDIDGRTLFSVASLVEPGSFDLQHIDGQAFRGVTFFTMTKASGEAGLLAMKLTAQDLAGRLQGTVQENPRA